MSGSNPSSGFGPDRARGRVALWLCVAAAASSLLAVGSFWLQASLKGESVMAGKVLPNFSADMPQVRTITITTNQGPYNLVRRGSGWIMPERGDYPVAPAALAELAKGLSDLSFKSARTSDPTQFGRLGVDDPSARTLTDDADGALITTKGGTGQVFDSLYLGQKGETIFVRKAGTNDVFEADGKMPPLVRASAWLDFKVIDIMPETIASVSGGRAGDKRYDIVRRPDGGFAPVGGPANVTATTAAIALTKWAPLDVMAASNLTTDPIATHATSLRTGVVISATAYQEKGRNWVALSADGEDVEAVNKINARTDGWAFELSPTDFADLTFDQATVVNGPNDAGQ